MPETIGYDDVAGMLRGAAARIRENHEHLSKLDSATGDGDHGVAMLRAADAIEKAVGEGDGKVGSLLSAVGWGVMSIDGGSTGPLFGSLLMGMSDAVGDADALDCDAVAAMLEAGLAKVRKQTKAQVGDKTMIDALAPAIDAFRAAADAQEDVAAALAKAAEAAAKGAAATVDMQAKFGRARNLGERTIGHVDPGATSVSLIFQGFCDGLGG